MPIVVMLLVCAFALVSPAVSGQTQGASDKAPAVILKTSASSMLAVARLITEETWNPILDRRIQDAPAARGLGDAWRPSDPRWQKARGALGARMTRILEAYARSDEIAGHVQSEVERIGAGPGLDAAVAALSGPAGAAVVREQARVTFIVTMMTATPNGPKIGSPEWNTRMGELAKTFERIGPSLPPDDGSHAAELKALNTGPAAAVLSRLWSFAIANATRQLTTALNLMLFDNQAAIDRAVASAVGGNVAPPVAATFDVERMVTCQDSWLDWKDDPVRAGAFVESIRSAFEQRDGDAFFTPKGRVSVAGLPVVQVFPQSVGMGVGFSVTVDASFDQARKALEQRTGKSLQKCDTSDNMRTCELELGERKTLILMADATGTVKTTLLGCYYYYEK